MITRLRGKIITERNIMRAGALGGAGATVNFDALVNWDFSSAKLVNSNFQQQGIYYNDISDINIEAGDTIILIDYEKTGNFTINENCTLIFLNSIFTAGNFTATGNINIYGNGIIDNLINPGIVSVVGDFQINTITATNDVYIDVRKVGDVTTDSDFVIKCDEFNTLISDDNTGFLKFRKNTLTDNKIIDIDNVDLTLECDFRCNYNTVFPSNYPIISKDSTLTIHNSTFKNSFVPIGSKAGIFGLNNTILKLSNAVFDVQDVYIADPITAISNIYYNGATTMNKWFINVANEFVISNRNIDNQINL